MSLLPTGSDWTFEAIEAYDAAIGRAAAGFGLECYPHQLEIITTEQMMDAYASIGMPVYYHHWSFGKHFLATESRYKRGQMGLAYEIVINSDPCIAYLMEENSLPMQALVIAHAAYGHNSFFKGNHLFRQWTCAHSIIDYLVFARRFIAECEEKHGQDAVEQLLDACHALMNVGVDRFKRAPKLSLVKEQQRQKERQDYQQAQLNELWRTLVAPKEKEEPARARFPAEPEENILYFIEKNAPLLEPWEREVVRIVRKIAQYFHPQRQTQVMNEGWASYWHYTLLNSLYDRGQVGEGFMLECLQSHANVLHQPPYNSDWYSGINPYALGFALWKDIRRMCESPTEEDRAWFPGVAGRNWLETFHFAMQNFKDESFIAQYLSPKVMRDFRFFTVRDDDADARLAIGPIHDDPGFRHLRQALAEQYNLGSREPDIQVWNVDLRGDRSLTLRYFSRNRRDLAPDWAKVLGHVAALWGFIVRLEEELPAGGTRALGECEPPRRGRAA
ncbi:SpoVR family protein [Geothrix sp. 21YS21S-2]|uniref:SpoVR family protein n=1 Tax=Geothrix sp. 21YS21S-2 TaxID=3068893 RepID=UPI0027B9D5C4|nr:SpoVR family protein [Geothrix sp. 21YS21S-2]